MERGRRLELEILKILEENLQTRLHRTGLLLNLNFPIIGASPDAIGEDFVRSKMPCKFKIGEEIHYKRPKTSARPKFFAQIQLQMFMKNVKKGYCV